MKPLLYVLRDAKSAPAVLKDFSHPPKVDGKTLKERQTLMLQGRPCVIYDLKRPPPWSDAAVVDLPLAADVLTYPVAFATPIDTRSKLLKALTEFIISGPELEEESEEEELAATVVTTTFADGYESADMEESSEEDDEDDDTEDDE